MGVVFTKVLLGLTISEADGGATSLVLMDHNWEVVGWTARGPAQFH